MPSQRIKIIFKFLVAAIFFFWLFWKIDWLEVVFYFRQLDIWWMFVFLAMTLGGIAVSAFKWKKMANFAGFSGSFKHYFKWYLTGAFINNFFPSILGGDAYRSYRLGKIEGGRFFEATAGVMADRITGLLGVLVLVLVFGISNFEKNFQNQILLYIVLFVAVFLVFFVFFLFFLRTDFWKKTEERFPDKIKKLWEALRIYLELPILWESVFWGAFFNFFGIGLATWPLFLDLHLSISLSDFMVAISLVSVVSSIPISIGNLGIKEWSFIFFFGLFGVDGEAALSVAIFSRFLQMAVTFLAIPFNFEEKNFWKMEK